MTVILRNKGCTMSTIGYGLVTIGAINWGLVGLSEFMHINLNVVNMLLGGWPMVEALVYVLVGIAGVMLLVGCKCKTCAACRADGGAGMSGM